MRPLGDTTSEVTPGKESLTYNPTVNIRFLIARELHEDQTPQSEEYLDGQLSI